MKKKHWLLSLVFMLAFSMILAACSGGSEETSTEEKENNDTPVTEEKPAEEVQDTLVFGRGGDSVNLDPITVTDGESLNVTKNIFETLVNYGQQNTEIEAGLAKEWKMSDDGLSFTFFLQEGVKFHDGTDFNAEAVKFNFDRWANMGEEAAYYYGSMFGGFAGDEGHVIKEVKVVDEYTVEFVLTRPLVPFLKNLAMSPFGIASPTAVEQSGEKFGENPVGTGAFKFVEWKRNERIVLEKNSDYWMEGYPKLNKLIFVSIPDNSARFNALVKGEIDLMDGVNPSDVTAIGSNSDLQGYERPSMNVGYLGLTNTRGPLKDKKVRQALSHAIDKQGIIDAFYGGQAMPAINPIPPSIEGYNDQVQDYPYDLEKAKALLAEAGYPDGFEMELWAMPVPRPYMPDGQKVAEVIQNSFAQIGVKTKIVSYEWATYLDKARMGEADAFLLGWTGDNGDADNFLYVLLDKDNIGSNNYTYYDNQEVHDLLVEAQITEDPATRNELYKKAQEIIKDDAPMIPLVHSTPALAGKANVVDFYPHPTGSDDFKGVYFK